MADIGLQSNGDDHGSSHHDADSLRNQESTAQHAASNPFTTPYSSRPSSPQASTSGYAAQDQPRYFRSRRVQKGTIEQPWLDRKDPKEKWVTIIPLLGICVGLMVTALLIWDGLRSVVNHKYCIVLDEQWANGFDEKIWTKEVALGGYGNGQFEMTTNTDENVRVEDGLLYIKPTLQDANLIETDGTIVNLTEEGICSSPHWFNCITITNQTNSSIVNPVKSGRISTNLTSKIKYGRVEVVAKLPSGDWLWPAIWMLPSENKYGDWPRSGEIDIMESRGNNWTYGQGGNNIVSSVLHFGPNAANDAWWTNNVKRKALHTTYASGFHTFGLEWSDDYLFTYIDNRLLQVTYNRFDKSLFQRGRFPLTDSNGTKIIDPWAHTGRLQTPFDENFYLIINVAVGATNGWFQDGKSGKPWVDGDPAARLAFWKARDQWLPTWEENGAMVIKSVKMWQQAGYNGCT